VDSASAMRGDSVEFDVPDLSASTYSRHPLRRWAALSLAIASVGGFVVLDLKLIQFAANNPSRSGSAYLLVALSVLFAFQCFSLLWWRFRVWARPPVRVRFSSEKFEFLMASGRTLEVRWVEGKPRVDMVVRSGDDSVPFDSKVWLVVTLSRRYHYHVLSRVIPYTYIPGAAVAAVLGISRQAGLPIQEIAYTPGFSNDPSRTWTLYRIGGVA